MSSLSIPNGILGNELASLMSDIEDKTINSDDFNVIENVPITFNHDTLTCIYTNPNITKETYCNVYFDEVDIAMSSSITVDNTEDGLIFKCQTLPEETIYCNITFTNSNNT